MGSPHRDDERRFTRSADDLRFGRSPFSLIDAFSCAWAGIIYAFSTQRNLKIHLAFALAAVVLGLAFGIAAGEWLAIVLCIAVVMALEVLNTAVESVVDLVSPEWNELAKRAKDCAAGAVYLAAFGSVAVAAIVFLPKMLGLLLQ